MATVAASSLEKQSPGARPCVPAASEVAAPPHEAEMLLCDGGQRGQLGGAAAAAPAGSRDGAPRTPQPRHEEAPGGCGEAPGGGAEAPRRPPVR